MRAAVCAAVLALGVAGCGTNNEESEGGGAATTNATSVPTATLDQAIADKVPADVKSKGSVTVGVDPTYAPNEFLDEDGKTIIGMDADLAKAIGTVTGVDFKLETSSFDGILLSVGKKFDVGMSSITDSKEREAKFDFVTYFTAGSSFFVAAQDGPEITGLDDLCGHTVAVQKGTTQQAMAEDQAKKCPAGKKLDVAVSPDQASANTALASGRADVGFADSPVAAYQVKQGNGRFKLTGEPLDSAPYGIMFPKDSKLAPVVQEAVQKLIDSDVYPAILKKWGVESGAIDRAELNGATS
nr:ABC transporter substrate-binding protein [Patulibacter sp. SYSU D01012]